jgi:hypothetical protein
VISDVKTLCVERTLAVRNALREFPAGQILVHPARTSSSFDAPLREFMLEYWELGSESHQLPLPETARGDR